MDGKDQGTFLKMQAPRRGGFCLIGCVTCDGLKRWALLTGTGIGWMR